MYFTLKSGNYSGTPFMPPQAALIKRRILRGHLAGSLFRLATKLALLPLRGQPAGEAAPANGWRPGADPGWAGV